MFGVGCFGIWHWDLGIWLWVWVLGFWDLAYGLSLKALGFCLVFWIKVLGFCLVFWDEGFAIRLRV